MTRAGTVALLVLVLVLVLLAASTAFANEGVVEAVGEAQMGSDKVAAKKAATADALKKCIEQVVGIAIKSDFSATQQEVVKNNQSEFYSKVRDNLVQQAEGFIQKYEVLDERVDGDIMKVKVRAYVFESKLKSEVKKLTELLAAAGNPKLMLVIQDVVVAADGKKRVAQESVLAAHLEKELLARGFEIRGQPQAKRVATESIDDYDTWLQDAGGAARLARNQGADILVTGRVEIFDKGIIEETGGLDALKGQTRVEIVSVVRGINAASEEVLSSDPVQMSSVGTSVERAVYRAFQGRGANLVKKTFDQLLDDLKTSFRKTADRGRDYVIALEGVKSFRKQGKGFLTLLEKLAGVSGVKQKSFKDDRLVIDLQCKCSGVELQERIFSAADGNGDFSSLDVSGASGNQMAFKL